MARQFLLNPTSVKELYKQDQLDQYTKQRKKQIANKQVADPHQAMWDGKLYVDYDYETNAASAKGTIDNKIGTTEEMRIPWYGIYKSLYLLQSADTPAERVSAVSLALNIWHDQAALFAPQRDYKLGGNNISYAPFTLDQYNALSNLNTRKWDMELRREEFG